MKIMVTGHSGMLGKEVVKAIERMGHNLMLGMGPTIDPNTDRIDITKEILVVDCCPDVVINCAGLVPQRNSTPAEMMRVNGYGPWNLADWCDQIKARLIQISTDCVFDGADYKPDAPPQVECNPPQPVTPYGYSKLAGEIRRDPHLTVRTSFVGFGKRGLIAELERSVADDKIYRASHELLWTGHTVRFVAEALVMLAERKISGLLHIPGESSTRYKLVRLLNNALDLGVKLDPSRDPKHAADRRLGSERWEREGLPLLPSFEWQLEWLRRSQ
jgi:dTDP-4-dehydrorhamnose reductase